MTNQCVQSTQSGLFTLPYITNSLKRFGLNYVSTAYRKKKRVGKLVTAVFVFWAFYEVLIKFNFCVCVCLRWTQFKNSLSDLVKQSETVYQIISPSDILVTLDEHRYHY